MKDPGLEPVVYEGYVNNSMFIDIMEKNKYQVLPQLRNLTSMELGCDVQGYSRAGKDTKIWYCALVAGRPSQELNKMRERYCFFHIHSEDSYETCGPRRAMTDIPRLFIVRYERYTSDKKTDTKKQENVFHAWYNTEADPVSTLVPKYNGSSDISEIVSWISQTIKDGDSREIPPFKTKAPELLPEDLVQSWSQSSNKVFSSGKNIKQWTI